MKIYLCRDLFNEFGDNMKNIFLNLVQYNSIILTSLEKEKPINNPNVPPIDPMMLTKS